MKNYYEILEVDKNASQEVIEKAYKILAKKYHPDLKDNEVKRKYEEKMKNINEAYSVLSNSFKRREYDEFLQNENTPNRSSQNVQDEGVSREEYQNILRENYELKQKMNTIKKQSTNKNRNVANISNDNSQNADKGTIGNMGKILKEQIKGVMQPNHNTTNMQNNINEERKTKHDFKFYLIIVLIITLVCLVGFLIYQIPPVKVFFDNLYQENIIFQAIVDIIKNTITAEF